MLVVSEVNHKQVVFLEEIELISVGSMQLCRENEWSKSSDP